MKKLEYVAFLVVIVLRVKKGLILRQVDGYMVLVHRGKEIA